MIKQAKKWRKNKMKIDNIETSQLIERYQKIQELLEYLEKQKKEIIKEK